MAGEKPARGKDRLERGLRRRWYDTGLVPYQIIKLNEVKVLMSILKRYWNRAETISSSTQPANSLAKSSPRSSAMLLT